MLNSSEVMATMPAVDINRAKKFYTDKLGLKHIADPAEDTMIFEAGNGSKILLYQREATKAEHTAATFSVEDLDKVVDDLLANGIVFEQYDMEGLKTDTRGVAEMDGAKAAWLIDSEGNILGIFSA